VPVIARMAGELDRLHQRTAFKDDDDLIFAHPLPGSVLDASKLRKRSRRASPSRTLQEWMGHRDYKTTLIYADYAPCTYERELMERAFGPASLEGSVNARGGADAG
jgi:integrase